LEFARAFLFLVLFPGYFELYHERFGSTAAALVPLTSFALLVSFLFFYNLFPKEETMKKRTNAQRQADYRFRKNVYSTEDKILYYEERLLLLQEQLFRAKRRLLQLRRKKDEA